jgi:predicted metal-dependent hydrolase
MFGTRIQTVAEALGYRVVWIETAAQISTAPAEQRLRLAEPVSGPEAELVDMVTRLRPALMIFDLSNSEIPWREWIALLKSAAATRRYPIICYGAHVEGQALVDARRRGADAAVARSHFAAELAALIGQHARMPDLQALQAACAEPLSDLARQGLQLFNHGEYFEAHEVLEAAWNADTTPGRELYRAVLQVAVAYLQIERGNYTGAIKMFLRVRQWIEPLPDVCRSIDVAALRRDAEQVRARLIALGPENIGLFDRSLFRPVRYREEA